MTFQLAPSCCTALDFLWWSRAQPRYVLLTYLVKGVERAHILLLAQNPVQLETLLSETGHMVPSG